MTEGSEEVKIDSGVKTKIRPNHFFAVRISDSQVRFSLLKLFSTYIHIFLAGNRDGSGYSECYCKEGASVKVSTYLSDQPSHYTGSGTLGFRRGTDQVLSLSRVLDHKPLLYFPCVIAGQG